MNLEIVWMRRGRLSVGRHEGDEVDAVTKQHDGNILRIALGQADVGQEFCGDQSFVRHAGLVFAVHAQDKLQALKDCTVAVPDGDGEIGYLIEGQSLLVKRVQVSLKEQGEFGLDDVGTEDGVCFKKCGM